MNFTLEYFPASGGASVAKDFTADAGWGFKSEWGGSFNYGLPDNLNLTIPKRRAAVLDSFEPRSIFILRDGAGNIFFQGINGNESRSGSMNASSLRFSLSGPYWYLEGLPFSRTISGDYWTGGAPGLGTHEIVNNEITAFNLNRMLDGTYMSSRAQLTEIFNFAIAKGAYFQFDPLTLPDIPILPTPFQNGTCDDAIRVQLQDIDAAVGFDHSTQPPTLFIRKRSDCTPVSRTLGDAQQVIDFDTTRRDDLRVPYVQLTFEGGKVVNGVSYPDPQTFTYPDPRPTGTLNNFYPFVATVPLNPLVVNSTSARLYTREITQDLAFLQAVKPEFGNVAEYTNLAIVAGSFKRSSSLPRMIIGEKGNYASWMGGTVQKDTITLKVSYSRVMNSTANYPIASVQEQTVTIPILATDINADGAGGELFSSTQIAAVGENPTDFATLPQIIYDSLNTPCYTGRVTFLESSTQGWVGLGNVLNLQGDASICRAEWNTMNALVQQVDFSTRGGGTFFVTVTLGVNKMLSPGQLRDRMRAKRLLRPTFTISYSGGQISGGTGVELPDQRGLSNSADGEPAFTSQNLYSNPNADGSRSNIYLNGSASANAAGRVLPRIELKNVTKDNATLSADGQVQIQPDFILLTAAPGQITPGQGGNQIVLKLSDLPNNGNGMLVQLRKISYRDADNNCVRMSFYCLASAPYLDP